MKHFNTFYEQEYIPVGCVPPAAVSIGGSPPGTPRSRHPREQTHPQADTLLGADTPPSRHPPWEQTHPPGADSCPREQNS